MGSTGGVTTVKACIGIYCDQRTVTVPPAALSTISVTPTNATVPPGGSQPFSATAQYADGSTSTITGVTWSSSKPNVATIDPSSGLATALGVGPFVIQCGSLQTPGPSHRSALGNDPFELTFFEEWFTKRQEERHIYPAESRRFRDITCSILAPTHTPRPQAK
jgi:hypothetical protein